MIKTRVLLVFLLSQAKHALQEEGPQAARLALCIVAER